MADLETLLAEREIRQILFRYCHGIDRGDARLVESCYHDGAQDVHGKYRGDGKAFGAYAVGVLSGRYAATSHTLGQSLCDVDGDSAHVETYVVAYHLSAEPAQDAHLYVFGGRYVDRFERRDGVWLIATRVVVRDWSVRHALSAEELARQVAEAPAFDGGRRDAGDLGNRAAFDTWRRTLDLNPSTA